MADGDIAGGNLAPRRKEISGYGNLQTTLFEASFITALNVTSRVFPEKILRGEVAQTKIIIILETLGHKFPGFRKGHICST